MKISKAYSKARLLILLLQTLMFCLACVSAGAQTLHTNPLAVDEHFEQAPLASHLLFRKANSAEPNSDVIATLRNNDAPADDWHRASTEADLLTHMQPARYWFRFTLHGNVQQQRELLLEFAHTYMYLFDVTLIRDGVPAEHFVTGHRFPFAQRPLQHPHFLFPITLQPNETVTVLMLIQGRPTLMLNRLNLWDANVFHNTAPQHLMLQWFFAGIIAVVALYNLMLALFTREPNLLYYVGFVIASGLLYFTLNGYSYQFLWPNAVEWNLRAPMVLALLALLANAQFFTTFLNLRTNAPGVAKSLNYFGVAVCAVILLQIPQPTPDAIWPQWLSLAMIAIFYLMILIVSVKLWRRGHSNARNYLAAWSIFSVMALLELLNESSLPQSSLVVVYGSQIGLVVTHVILSISLAWRINELRNEQQYARAQSTAKTTFLAKMSHEIRTPMNGILGVAQLLSTTRLDQEQRRYINLIESCSRTLLTIINDLLDYSKIEAGKLTLEKIPFDLRKVVNETASLFVEQARQKNIVFEISISDTVADGYLGDPIRLQQILINLLSNALKFTQAGSVIINVHASSISRGVHITIADTGIGIPFAAQTSLFEAFQQAEHSIARRYGGTGLGLAICKQLCELMGGDIGVISREQHGSRFWIELPLEPYDKNLEANTTAAAPTRENLRITEALSVLVAEDNPVNVEVVKGMLARLGHRAVITTDGEQAVAAYLRQHFDVILMDCEMPVVDGFEATRQIRIYERYKSLPPVPIIALTAHALPEQAQRCIDSGMTAHLSKPIQISVLEQALASHLADNNHAAA